MTKKMCPVVHFEMPAENQNRMADFYASVFGWKTEMLGPEMGDYVLATTIEKDSNGRYFFIIIVNIITIGTIMARCMRMIITDSSP